LRGKNRGIAMTLCQLEKILKMGQNISPIFKILSLGRGYDAFIKMSASYFFDYPAEICQKNYYEVKL